VSQGTRGGGEGGGWKKRKTRPADMGIARDSDRGANGKGSHSKASEHIRGRTP